jgi:membrane protease YdiL (CAAX protease family)
VGRYLNYFNFRDALILLTGVSLLHLILLNIIDEYKYSGLHDLIYLISTYINLFLTVTLLIWLILFIRKSIRKSYHIPENRKFHNKPFLAVVLISNLYIICQLILIDISREIVYLDISNFYRNVLLQSYVGLFMVILFLFITPKILHLPEGQRSLEEYFVAIKLKQSNLTHNLSLGIICCIIFSILGLIGGLLINDSAFEFSTTYDRFTYWNANWIFNLNPAIWEEILFRGIILTLLLKKLEIRKAIFVDGLLFGLLHILNILVGRSIRTTIYQIFAAFVLGLLLAHMYVKTGNLWAPIFLHYLSNTIVLKFSVINHFPDGYSNLVIYFIFSRVIPTILCFYVIKKYYNIETSFQRNNIRPG